MAHVPQTHSSEPPPLFAVRFPTDEEQAGMSRQTRTDFQAGDVVIEPDRWGRALFVVDSTHIDRDGLLGVIIAREERWNGQVIADNAEVTISGYVNPKKVIRVCSGCLHPDPRGEHTTNPPCPTTVERT